MRLLANSDHQDCRPRQRLRSHRLTWTHSDSKGQQVTHECETDRERKTVQIMCASAFLFVASVIVIQVYLMFAAMQAYETDYSQVILSTIQIIPLQMNQQSCLLYPLFYIILLQVLTDRDFRCLDRLTQELVHKRFDVEEIMNQRKKIIFLREKFEDSLNYIPFLTFSILYVTIPGVVSSIANHCLLDLPRSRILSSPSHVLQRQSIQGSSPSIDAPTDRRRAATGGAVQKHEFEAGLSFTGTRTAD